MREDRAISLTILPNEGEDFLHAGMENDDWELLLRRIKEGRCTPFLGAGACSPNLPLSNQIAQELSEKYNYPLPDIHNLPRVAQFLAIERRDSIFPKELVIDILKRRKTPDFTSCDLVHSILAELPLPVYLTTNYDDFMIQALQNKRRNVVSEYCRWNRYISKEPYNIDEAYKPSVENPLVYYLHGFWEVPESLVLTEDDYIDFLVNVSEDMDHSLHHRIRRSLTGTSLIFIGYHLEDLSFRTIFRGLINSPEKSLKRTSLSVQIPPADEHRQSVIRSINNLEKFVTEFDANQQLKDKVGSLISELQNIISQSSIERENKELLYQKINHLECQLINLTVGDNMKKKFIINLINILQESIGLLPTKGEPKDKQAIQFLEKYYKEMDIHIYWGNSTQFAEELRQRWEDFERRNS